MWAYDLSSANSPSPTPTETELVLAKQEYIRSVYKLDHEEGGFIIDFIFFKSMETQQVLKIINTDLIFHDSLYTISKMRLCPYLSI